ncbi:MAG: serine hydroxymethyltransferase, partial [Bacteroidia bacterium]|nr:serine hydroxymethyltransferase [Bacteroidia bacterium]
NHIVLVDLRSKGLTGRDAEKGLEKAGITVNKNLIPYDPQPPLIASGIRLGTPALTTRGMGETDMQQIAKWIDQALSHLTDESYLSKLRKEIRDYLTAYPLPYGPAAPVALGSGAAPVG